MAVERQETKGCAVFRGLASMVPRKKLPHARLPLISLPLTHHRKKNLKKEIDPHLCLSL